MKTTCKYNSNQVYAARHICEEATKVLSILRRGPPVVSRGALVHNLRELRRQVKSHFLDPDYFQQQHTQEEGEDDQIISDTVTGHDIDNEDENVSTEVTTEVTTEVVIVNVNATDIDTNHSDDNHDTDEEDPTEKDTITFTDSERYDEAPFPPPPTTIMNHNDYYYYQQQQKQQYHLHLNHLDIVQIGVYAQPFLDIILDPRAAGPHTLIALRSLHRLISRQSLTLTSSSSSSSSSASFHQKQQQINNNNNNNNNNTTSFFQFEAQMEPLMRSILECRFEQTDAGADEAVEMAIADLLSLIVSYDTNRVMNSEVIMEAFNTVFVTRNTFVHSPALCYHFEQVLDGMIRDLFNNLYIVSTLDGIGHCAIAAKMIMEFLVSQLLHTPMTLDGDGGSSGGNNYISRGSMEAFTMHNDTRILCLRLIQTCLKIGWGSSSVCSSIDEDDDDYDLSTKQQQQQVVLVDGILKIIKDELCLSLLLVGQGIWAYQDPTSGALPGMISMNVLSEICSTISTLWSIQSLRNVLTTQFENIFTGFYQRALSLLRRLPVPNDSVTFQANQIFDAEVEIILETLVDILSFHTDDSIGGTFETLFIVYDCNMSRSDVAVGLLNELTRCCSVNVYDKDPVSVVGARSAYSTPVRQSSTSSSSLNSDVEIQLRDVPAHLKELCADAIFGILKTIFRVSNETVATIEIPQETSLRYLKEQKMIMRKAVELFNEKPSKGFSFMVENGLFEDSVTPQAVASFLRSGLVLGLDKRVIGAYLGEKGKSPGQSPRWERDWFHKEALSAYCASFHFKNQSLLDGLRMFLAAFRLPGEAQQIDRILQAFAESCGLQCEESPNGSLQLFSTDPKKASDAAYLLSFSIIMLNTDLHNENIKPEKKMKVEDFVKTNTDYGRDITDPDKPLPREYLESIYERIKEEHIRTEGEGADGIMTFERWKDVMRNLGEDNVVHETPIQTSTISGLLVEAVKDPIFSAICGFWGVSLKGKSLTNTHPQSGMIGVQGSRFGMDLTYEMIKGLKTYAPGHLFQDFFIGICKLTGLIGDYNLDPVDRTSNFVESVERQSVVVLVMKVASDFGDFLGTQGWICVMSILFELRDLKLLGGGTQIKHRSLIIESDPDLLRSDTRRDWEMRLVKQCYEATGGDVRNQKATKRSGLLGSMGRALFGSNPDLIHPPRENFDRIDKASGAIEKLIPSKHGKEELVLWDDLAPSDEEDELDFDEQDLECNHMREISLGSKFEKQLIIEDDSKFQPGPPITGLETYEDTRVIQKSPRARVRRRLSRLCDFSMILSETRFLDIEGVKSLLQALMYLIGSNSNKESSQMKNITTMSPGSEALAEVMITEITLKNRDRIAPLWSSCLKSHYQERLSVMKGDFTSHPINSILVIPGIEKCLTGLLRICYHTVHREGVNNGVLHELKLLIPYCSSLSTTNPTLGFDKHIAEGLWRICRDVDGLFLVGRDGWAGILDLMKHCAKGGALPLLEDGAKFNILSDDDPSLQAFRCMHLILHSNELRNIIPFDIIHAVRELIGGGERHSCPKLSLAGLDLLLVLLTRLHLKKDDDNTFDAEISNAHWVSIIEGIAEASESKFTNTRQHSISMLRDSLIDTYSDDIQLKELCRVLNGICMPTINQRISELIHHQTMLKFDEEEIMIELELCISIIFKPFLHHLEKLIDNIEELTAVWMSLLSVISQLLGKEKQPENIDQKVIAKNHRLLKAAKDLATEHLRNSVMVLITKDVLKCEDSFSNGQDISSMTWNAINNMTYCKHLISEWKKIYENTEK